MNKQYKNIITARRTGNNPFFKEFDLKSSLILILGFLAFVIIFVDLTSELASEKDEIGTVLATLDKSGNPEINITNTGLNIPVCDNIIILPNISVNPTDVLNLHPDRAPPFI